MKNHNFILGSLPLILLLAGLTAQPVHAQHAFTVVIPGIEKAYRQATVQTPDGGFVLLFRSFVEREIDRYTKHDSSFFGLAKLSADGILEWSHQIRVGTRHAAPISLLQTPTGDLVVIGRTGEDNYPQGITWLRLNPHGYVQAAKHFSINERDILADGLMLYDGSVMIGGSTANGPIFQAFTLRLSSDGEIMNAQLYPKLQSYWRNNLKTIKMLSSGSIVFTGNIVRNVQETRHESTFICLTDKDGAVQSTALYDFDSAFPTMYFDSYTIQDIYQSPNGSLNIIGNASHQGCTGSHHISLTAQTDLNGNLQDARLIDAPYSLPLYTLLSSNNGKTVIVGSTDWFPSNSIFVTLDQQMNPTKARQTIFLESDQEWHCSNTDPSIIKIENEDVLFTESRKKYTFNQYENYLERTQVVVTRFSTDFAPCNGVEQKLHIDGNNILSAEEIAKTEKPNEDNQQAPIDLTNATKHITVTPVELEVNVRTIIDHKTVDFPLEVQVICQENPMLLSSALNEPGNNIEASNALLNISPNIIRQGKDIEVAFTIAGNEAPEITLLTIATGETVRAFEPGTIQWDDRTGRGTAFVNTAGLASGVYLVRVRSGEKQLTGKVEVQ